jgi:hypothetical protein
MLRRGGPYTGRQVRGVVGLGLAGGLLEAGCLWIWWHSPGLTAGYNADYTREFFARLPLLSVPTQTFEDAGAMVRTLEVGLLLMIGGYVLGLAVLGGARSWVVWSFALLFRTTLVALPGLFSTDIFSYVMYGRIAAVYGQSPYLQPPNDFPNDPFLAWVFPFWRDQPSVYGPVWTDFSWLLSKLTGHLSNFDQAVAYRLSLTLLELALLGVLWWLLGRLLPERRIPAFAVFAWNPLVLFDLVGSSHNDVAMLVLLLLGVVAFATPRGIVALTLSALVKYTTGVVAVIAAVAWAAQAGSTRARLVRLGASGLLTLIGVVMLAWPWVQTPQALGSIADAAGGRLVLNSTPDLIALTVADQLLVPAGMERETAQAVSRLWIHWLTRVIFGVYFVCELWQVWKRPSLPRSLEAATRALLILPLLVLTWVWSWYFSWSLVLAVLLDWKKSRLPRLVTTYTLFALPVVYAHQYLNQDLPGAAVLLFTVGPLATLITRQGSTASTGGLALES